MDLMMDSVASPVGKTKKVRLFTPRKHDKIERSFVLSLPNQRNLFP
jgi:hypothetical protein